ncbi:TonB-dependent receptor [Erythrobacter sp.]|uniref:TonB-dependent receptor n=1 Tax=Erythrobacter sp. TaxID=1042 RepID=UPI0031202DF7
MKASARSSSRRGALGVTTSVLALAMGLPAAAQAQEAPDESVAEGSPEVDGYGNVIIVSGIRAGIANAITTKRDELSIVEAVSAEDIGKLPDISIAESLARLPGLTAQRVNGRAQVISIRGLSPDFSTTLLNGRQQASSGDNRAVEFDQYPSELLGSVVVYKTPDAAISGFGLSGTADLRTVRPLDLNERVVALNLRGEVNSGGRLNDDVRNYGFRASGSYIDQNADGTLGWAIGFAHLDSPSSNRHYKAYNYETFCFNGESFCTFLRDRISPDSADRATFLTGQEIFATSRLNKRDAAIGILEWEPSDAVHLTSDLYYSKFKQREVTRGVQWFSNLWADSQTFSNVGTADVGGTLVGVSGENGGVAPILRNDLNTRSDELFAGGLNGEFAITDRFHFEADLSYSRNRRDESITETYAGYGCCVTAGNQNANRVFDTIGFDISDLIEGDYPSYSSGLDYADASQVSLGDRAPWGGWGHDGQIKEPHVREEVFALDLKFGYEFDTFIKSITAGVNYTIRDKKKRVDEFDLFLKNNRLQTLVDGQYLASPTSLGYAGFGNVLSVDLASALPVYYDRVTFINNDTYDKAWSIDEEVLTGFVKATFETGGLHGNLGIQVVEQRQQSSGSAINRTLSPTVVTPVTEGKTYTDVLPSLNAFYDLGGGHRIRLAAAKVLARPRVDDLRANFTPSFGNPCGGSPPCVPGQVVNPWSASGGNPLLDPWRAKALDVSYEWYIGPASYISIAGFYKKLDSYIYNQIQPFDFSGLPLPPTAANIPAGVIISPIGSINQPANGNGGSIKGIEVSGALEFGRITSFLDGFGASGSFSYTKSDLKPTASEDPTVVQATRIPGLSGYVYNLTGYYEKGGFQARASYRYRSGFKGEVVQLFATRGLTEILADDQLDAQVGYTFEKGSLEGLGILLQVYNVTDSPYRTRLGVDNGGARTADGAPLPEVYETYGRQFLLGVNYRF